MTDEIIEFQRIFEKIKRKGWIKEKQNGKGSCGYTFESLLNKEEDNFPTPDYYGIEIKTMNDNTKTNLHLFNLTPDGDCIFPIKRLLFEIGSPDKNNKNYRTLYKSFSTRDYVRVLYGRKVILRVNYEKEKVELVVLDYRNKDINIGISWSFSYLKERLLLKLRYLAFIRVSSRIISGEGYYYYHKMNVYKLRNFSTFIKLIDIGIIEITFKIGTHKSDDKIGQVYDHGTDFSIKVSDIELLYDRIC
jgi:hypothetical protein